MGTSEGDGERRRRRVRGGRPGRIHAAEPPAPSSATTAPTRAPLTDSAGSATEPVSATPADPASRPIDRAPKGQPPTGTDVRDARPGDTRRRRPAPPASEREPYDSHGPVGDDHDRGLRGLIGGGSSQVSVAAAMRARDAARPSDDDIADAEATLTIIHRGWVPRDG
jgi:hypothetical protein